MSEEGEVTRHGTPHYLGNGVEGPWDFVHGKLVRGKGGHLRGMHHADADAAGNVNTRDRPLPPPLPRHQDAGRINSNKKLRDLAEAARALEVTATVVCHGKGKAEAAPAKDVGARQPARQAVGVCVPPPLVLVVADGALVRVHACLLGGVQGVGILVTHECCGPREGAGAGPCGGGGDGRLWGLVPEGFGVGRAHLPVLGPPSPLVIPTAVEHFVARGTAVGRRSATHATRSCKRRQWFRPVFG